VKLLINTDRVFPLGRFASAEDIANAALFLASDMEIILQDK
jgi:NAD(P)-dependent dehydrogenase (short-subunit alcohol dehydrogenase family)